MKIKLNYIYLIFIIFIILVYYYFQIFSGTSV